MWECLGDSYSYFEAIRQASFILGNELWEEHFESLLALVKEYIWEERKYGDNACAHQPRPQSPTGDLGDIAGQNGKRLCQGGKPGTILMFMHVAPPTLVGA